MRLYRKSSWESFKTFMDKKKNDILNNFENKSAHVEEIWNSFKSALQQGISQFAPVRKFGVKKVCLG